jgi:hypothetical protein
MQPSTSDRTVSIVSAGGDVLEKGDYDALSRKKNIKLRGLRPRATTERPPLSAKLVPTFADRGISSSLRGGSSTTVI